MLTEVIISVIGLVIGLLTGFYFERRSTRSAKQENDELKRQLRELRESVYSVGGSASRVPVVQSHRDLLGDVLGWVSMVQDPSGRVVRSQLVTHFVEQGHSKSDVEDVLTRLSAAGSVRVHDRWVEVI